MNGRTTLKSGSSPVDNRDLPSLRDRVIAVLRHAGHPCTCGELMFLGCHHIHGGETAASVHEALEAIERDGGVCRVIASQPLRGRRPGLAWKLCEQLANPADWKPVRLAKE